jgi:hypothetical protein
LSVLEKKEKAKQQSHMNWILSMIEQGDEKDMKERVKEGVKTHISHPPPVAKGQLLKQGATGRRTKPEGNTSKKS